MPSCRNCKMLENNTCKGYKVAVEELKRPLPPPPLGGCMIPIVESYCEYIVSSVRVLDIGCGSWAYLRDYCRRVGAEYEGIDIRSEYFGIRTVATRIENLNTLSFDDESFDIVIGNQSMEHWAENGCTLSWGLFQCFRVLKPNGRLCLNVPIHFHGTKEFMLGQLNLLETLLSNFSNTVQWEKWGEPCDPLPEVKPFPGYWALSNKPAYVLDIQAVKDKPVADNYSNQGAFQGRLTQLRNYPMSYNVYRILRKTGIIKT